MCLFIVKYQIYWTVRYSVHTIDHAYVLSRLFGRHTDFEILNYLKTKKPTKRYIINANAIYVKRTSVKSNVISCMATCRPGHILGPCPKGNEAYGSNFSTFESLNHRPGRYSNGSLK